MMDLVLRSTKTSINKRTAFMRLWVPEPSNLVPPIASKPFIETIEPQLTILQWSPRYPKIRNSNQSMIDLWTPRQSLFDPSIDDPIPPLVRADPWPTSTTSNRMRSNSHLMNQTIQTSWAAMEYWSPARMAAATFSTSIKSRCSFSPSVLSCSQSASSNQERG